MFERLTGFLARLSGDAVDPAEAETRLAAASLLAHVAAVDGDFSPSERQTLLAQLRRRFDLGAGEARALLAESVAQDRATDDLDDWTGPLKRSLDADGRRALVAMLWRVAEADGVIHEFEDSLIRRIAELLDVREAAAADRAADAGP